MKLLKYFNLLYLTIVLFLVVWMLIISRKASLRANNKNEAITGELILSQQQEKGRQKIQQIEIKIDSLKHEKDSILNRIIVADREYLKRAIDSLYNF